MRTLKFRVWDKNLKKFLDPAAVTVGGDGTLYDECTVYNNQKERQEAWVTQQYVGVHDITGEEIYEGDIVRRLGNHYVYSVEYSPTYACYQLRDVDNDLTSLASLRNNLEIVGTLFKTPEIMQ
jgi:hypothetical protein